jgi:hypothetical protein
MAYATVAQVRAYLPQLPNDSETDALLADILERATDAVAAVMGFRFEGYVDDFKKVAGSGTVYLILPPHAPLSVETVADNEGEQVTGWEPYGRTWLFHPDGWGTTRYTIGAQWGYGDPPPGIQEVTLEVAVNIWRAKDAARFSDYVGVAEGGAVAYAGAFTAQQRAILTGWVRRFGFWGT